MQILTSLILFIIGTIPILFAAVEPWIWSAYGLMMAVAFVLYLWTSSESILSPPSSLLSWMLALYFIWTLVLCLPVPFSILSVLSPVRADLSTQTALLADVAPTWQTISYLPKTALCWWSFLASMALFSIVLRGLSTDRKIRHRIVLVMIGIGLFESIYGLIQTLMPSMGVLWVDYIHSYLGTARGTFINRNNFAGYLEMIWPLALGVTLSMTGRVSSLKEALNSEKMNRQALMALGIIVLLMALIFTRSRGGIISGLAGFAAFSLLARKELKTIAKQARLLLGGIAVLLVAYMATIGIGPIVQRFLSVQGGGISRMEIWKDSLALVKDHPMGIGLANYENVFALYNQSSVSNETVVFTHNDYFQLLIETGWVGFALLIGAFFIYLWKSARGVKKIDARQDPLTFFLAVGAFSGLVSIAVHSIFDFNLQIPANCLYFVVLIILLNSCVQGGQKKSRLRTLRKKANPETALIVKRASN